MAKLIKRLSHAARVVSKRRPLSNSIIKHEEEFQQLAKCIDTMSVGTELRG
jgi:hypothetical protein